MLQKYGYWWKCSVTVWVNIKNCKMYGFNHFDCVLAASRLKSIFCSCHIHHVHPVKYEESTWGFRTLWWIERGCSDFLKALLIAPGKYHTALLHTPPHPHPAPISWAKHLGTGEGVLTIWCWVRSDGLATGHIWSAQTFCESFAWSTTHWIDFSFHLQWMVL